MAEEQALSLSWVFGTSANVPNNIVYLADGRVCYLAANTAIIYDKKAKHQTFLQGHTNAITCIASTSDRSVILTADAGPDASLVLWSAKDGAALATVPAPHRVGIAAMALSPDDKLLATISAPDASTGEQEVGLWSLAADLGAAASAATAGATAEAAAVPLPQLSVTSTIPAGDAQLHVAFNPNNVSELITTGRRRVYFWASQLPASARFKYYSPPLKARDFNQAVGDFTMSTFVPGTSQALTATTDGDLVVWEEQGAAAQMGTRATDRRAIKIVRVHGDTINYLSTVSDFVITGGADGCVRFFDPLLRLAGWFDDLNVGGILGVSFSHRLPSNMSKADAVDLNQFIVPDFVVSTTESRVVSVRASMFEDGGTGVRQGTVALDAVLTDAVAALCHPTKMEFMAASGSGLLQRWDMLSHRCVGQHTFGDGRAITCLAYSRDGSFAVAGLATGQLYMLHSDSFEELHAVMHNTKAALLKVAVAAAGDYVAAVDTAGYVLLYGYTPYKAEMRWGCIGKCKGHHGGVLDLMFGESPSGRTRLFSLGSDGRLAEYDLAKSSVAAGLVAAQYSDLPHGADGHTAFSFAPPLPYFKHSATDTLLLLADDGCKYRLFNPDAKANVATFLGPTFGGPTTQLCVFRSVGRDASSFLAYSTGRRVVGLVAWPLDGHPAQTMGLIAHPGAIHCVSISCDGRKLLTCGADCTMGLWDVSTAALHAAARAAAAAPDRWQRLVGGDQLMDDLSDFFVLAQLKAQEAAAGAAAGTPHAVAGKVPVSLVPDVMRAIGHYPSNSEIQDIMSHISFLGASRGQDDVKEVDLQDFLMLYINHRPYYPITQEHIAAAFAALGANAATGKLASYKLQARLTQVGEPINPDELRHLLRGLTASDALPDEPLTAADFSADILGFQ